MKLLSDAASITVPIKNICFLLCNDATRETLKVPSISDNLNEYTVGKLAVFTP